MSGPLSPQEIDAYIGKLSVQLDQAEIELGGERHPETGVRAGGADYASVIARENYTMAYAKAFLASTGPMDVRKQEAIQATHDQRLAAELADVVVRGLVRRMKTIQSRIDTGRTRSANSRSEHSIARTGAWGS
jgi:hypothetical protein